MDLPDEATDRWKFMVRMDNPPAQRNVRDTPSIDIGTFRKVEAMSTSPDSGAYGHDDDDVIATDAAGEIMQTAVQRRRMFHFEAWPEACEFFGFDRTSDNPNSGVWFPGWSQTNFLKAYQALSVTWVLKTLLQGRDWVCVAHNMGLGKTGMCLAVMRLLSGYARLRARSPDWTPAASQILRNPCTLTGLPWADLTIKPGCVVVLAPGALLPTWAKEMRKFYAVDRTRPMPKLIIAWGAVASRDFGPGGSFEGCYRREEEVSQADRPDEALLRQHRGRLPIHSSGKRKGQLKITARWLLERSPEGNAYPWHNEWVVLSTPHSITSPRMFLHGHEDDKVLNAPSNSAALRLNVGYVYFDEFHTSRNHTNGVWNHVVYMQGQPQVIPISGTPFAKSKDMMTPLLAATGRYYDGFTTDGNGVRRRHSDLYEVYHKATAALPKMGLPERTREHINNGEIWSVHRQTEIIDKCMEKRKPKISPNSTKAVDDAASQPLPEKVVQACNQFAEFYARHTIAFPTELVWKPDADYKGYNAIDIPPHSTYRVNPGIPEKWSRYLKPKWEATVKKLDANGTATPDHVFFNKAMRFQVYALIPGLALWPERQPELKKELNDFTAHNAPKIFELGKESWVYEYMNFIDESPGLQLIRNIMREVREQDNWLEDGRNKRKIVIMAFTPIITAILNLWLQYLVEDDTYPVLTEDDDFTHVANWMRPVDREEAITKFRTSKLAADYQDQPFVMNCSFNAVGTGISLDPADILISVDSTWLLAKEQQGVCRISRSKMVQRAKFTEAILIRCNETWAPLHKLIDRRHASQEGLVSLVTNLNSDDGDDIAL